MMDALLDQDLPWPDVSGRSVLVVGVGDGAAAGACAVASMPFLRGAAGVAVGEVRPSSGRAEALERAPGEPVDRDLVQPRTSRTGDASLLLLLPRRSRPAARKLLAEELSLKGFDLYLLVELGGPSPEDDEVDAPPCVRALRGGAAALDALRRTGQEVWQVLLAPGAAGTLLADDLEQVVSTRAVGSLYLGCWPLEGLRRSLRSCALRSPDSGTADFLASFLNGAVEADDLGRVQVPQEAFPDLPERWLTRALVFGPRTSAEQALEALARVRDRSLLAEVATRHREPRVRREAANQAGLGWVWERMLLEDQDPDLRLEAVARVESRKALGLAQARDPEERIRRAARKQDEWLARAAKRGSAPDAWTRVLLAMEPVLGQSRANPKAALAVGVLMLSILALGAWIMNGSWRAADYFAQGVRLQELGEGDALLWYARAAQRRPGVPDYRRAAASVLHGQPSLVFGRPVGPREAADVLALSARGGCLALAADRTVRLFDAATGAEVRSPLAHAARVTCLAFAPQRSAGPLEAALLASGSADGRVRLTDLGIRSNQGVLAHPQPVDLVVVGESGRVTTADRQGVLRTWRDGRVVREVRTGGRITDLAADGRFASVREGDGSLWAPGASEPRPLPRPGRPVRSVLLDPAGRFTLTLDNEHEVVLWDPLTLGWDLRSLGKGSRRADFSPDGRRLLLEGEPGLRLWRLPPLQERGLPFRLPGLLTGFAFSRDGRFLAVATEQGAWVVPAAALQEVALQGDLDEPPGLLDLEARLYTGKRLHWDGTAVPLTPEERREAAAAWERLGAAHAAVCRHPAANLWRRFRESGEEPDHPRGHLGEAAEEGGVVPGDQGGVPGQVPDAGEGVVPPAP